MYSVSTPKLTQNLTTNPPSRAIFYWIGGGIYVLWIKFVMSKILQNTLTYWLLVRLERCIVVSGQEEDSKKGETVKKIKMTQQWWVIYKYDNKRQLHKFLSIMIIKPKTSHNLVHTWLWEISKDLNFLIYANTASPLRFIFLTWAWK